MNRIIMKGDSFMESNQKPAQIVIQLAKPERLDQIQDWAEVALAVGFPETAKISTSLSGLAVSMSADDLAELREGMGE